MGNSPSKSNNAPSGLNSSSSNSTTTVASANATEATEPPDRKFPITHTSNSIVIKNNKQSYNKSKLQPKITSKSPVKFTYFHEDDSLEDGFESHPPYGRSNSNSSNSRSSPFDLEIDLQMAKTLNINNSNKCHHSTSPIAVTSTNTSANNNPNVDEMSSSFSDLFTNPSSPSSSLSITPPFNNLPPIIEEQHTKQRSKLPTVHNSSSSSSAKKSSKRQQMSNFDIDSVIEKLLKCGDSTNSPSLQQDFVIKPHEIATICSKAREEFLNQPTLLRLNAPIKVVGDIHGQFNDLLRILKLSGFPPDSSYLFLGDYVDRGKQSLETILLMLCFKIKYPNNFFMLRGNHECANITKIYGFYDECKRRVNLKCWKNFIDVFNTLPIAAVINDKIFCIHGGLSPFLQNLSQIESILRPTDIPEIGLLADLLWSDPDPTVNDWMENDRGVSYCFGKKVVEHFCKKFKFDLVIRGHMVVEDGYEFFAKKKLVTVFSAPNYCGEFNNWGAVMSVDRSLMCSFELLKPTKK